MSADDGSVQLTGELGQRPGASAIGFGSLWVAQPDRGVVSRLALDTGSVTDTIRVGNAPSGVAVGEGAVWVTNAGDGTVSRIDPDTNEESQRLHVGTSPTGIAVGDGVLWVADSIGGALLRVDPTTEEVVEVAARRPAFRRGLHARRGVGLGRAELRRARRPDGSEHRLHDTGRQWAVVGRVGLRLGLGRQPSRRHGHPPRALDRSRPGDDPGGTGPERAGGGGRVALGRQRARGHRRRDRPLDQRRGADRGDRCRGGVALHRRRRASGWPWAPRRPSIGAGR